jgi:hypothetical protein
MDLEGRNGGHGLIEVPSQHLCGWSEEIYEKPVRIDSVLSGCGLTAYLLNTSVQY